MPDPLFGYLDAGSGSMILQVLAGGLAAVAVAGRLFWNRILTFLRIRKPREDVAATPAAKDLGASDSASSSGGTP